jgi:hypothetical protein
MCVISGLANQSETFMTKTSSKMSGPYIDDYATCERTYVTLRVYSDTIPPEEISSSLGLTPTSTQHKGRVRNPHGRRPIVQKLHGWFLSSEGRVESRDVRRHLDWLLDQISGAADELTRLTNSVTGGTRADISCAWFSAFGHGGPTLSPSQMERMGTLGIDCWFDLYVSDVAKAESPPER